MGPPIEGKIGFIGGGNMTKAICAGLVRSGLTTYSQIYVSTSQRDSLDYWHKLGANGYNDNGIVVDKSDFVFLAIKPHIFPFAIASALVTSTTKSSANKLFISIMAGTTLEVLEKALIEFKNSRVIRAMPNTPLMVGEGCVAYCSGSKATPDDVNLVKSIFQVMGICEEIPESIINGVGALAGSGPAFIYLVIESLSDGAVKQGVPRAMATKLAAQMVLGSAKMVLETNKHTGTLKDEVCSPGGTTIVGIHALERGGVRSAFMDAIEAAAKRSGELSQSK